jgi:hypothetical protein
MVILHFGFLASRGKRIQNDPQEAFMRQKFCILDETKHDPKNFSILHSTIPK